ncbi:MULTISPECIES: type IV pilin-like G/H family protein [unclassified Spirulina]|uniref:type IV pilin-like G/H family protein n=1 Tax=unclassified Spirulina TaxID=2684457 RepID=UPI00194EBA8B|nr:MULTISPECIES: type IV pilin-like G/H family protein [Spirulina]MEA5469373.1 type IV pilin-like G/H family protein [Spirulina sp. 06S082]
MKSEFPIKFLQYLKSRCDRENGSVWFILLVIAIVCGLFIVLILPQFLGRRGHSRTRISESRNNVGAMNRAQQAFYLENQYYATDITQLGLIGLGLLPKTVNYKYEIAGKPEDRPIIINNLATPLHRGLKANLGIVGKTAIDGDIVFISIVCESQQLMDQNLTWGNLPTEIDEKTLNCDGITIGDQPLNFINKWVYPEGQWSTGVINQAQQNFYKKNKYFTTNLVQLDTDIPSQTESYKYEIIGTPEDRPTIINILATPRVKRKIAYLMIVSVTLVDGELVPIAASCQSKTTTGKNPTWQGLPTQLGRKSVDCDGITVGDQRLETIWKDRF